jgi:hypothetical protein
MRDYILANREQAAFQTSGAHGQEYVRRNYSLTSFTQDLTDLIASI